MRIYKYQFEIKDGPQHQRIHKGGKIRASGGTKKVGFGFARAK
jgi:hypothetical protein